MHTNKPKTQKIIFFIDDRFSLFEKLLQTACRSSIVAWVSCKDFYLVAMQWVIFVRQVEIDLECGGKRYSERRRFYKALKSGAALASRLRLSPHSRNKYFSCFSCVSWGKVLPPSHPLLAFEEPDLKACDSDQQKAKLQEGPLVI